MNEIKALKKVALVTGASSGIGRATVLALREAGFITIATAPTLEEIIGLKDHGFETFQLDVTDESSMSAAIRAAEDRFGAIDVLVNNAGFGQYGPIEEVPLDAVRHQFEVNVFGLIRMCQLVLPGMRNAGHGRIINVSSVAGEIAQPGGGIYHATKHAVEAIDATLRVEVSPFNIDVIGILPGPVATHFEDYASAHIPETGPASPYAAFKENLKRTTRRMFEPGAAGVLEPEDVARVIVEAATATRPSTNYYVGLVSKVLSVLHAVTPDRVWDAAAKRMVPFEEKKTA